MWKVVYVYTDAVEVVPLKDGKELKMLQGIYGSAMFNPATTEEIAVGHRIDMPSLPKPIGSLQELHPEFAKVLHENFLELLGDDFPIENRISPLCEVKDHEAK
ncbi:hypothetical protein LXD34_003698 [Acinetobacter baumannii]